MTTLSEALAPRSDQLNADDLIPGPRVLKITGARVSSEGREKKIVINYEGDGGKPWKPCKTMGRAMVMVWGITDDGFEQQLIGKSIRVYRDPEVTFGDQGQIGGIRISHMSHIDKPESVKLTVSQGKKRIFTFHPLVTDVPSTAFTLDQARADIEAADTLDALKVVWQRKLMAPFRDELQPDLDARKAALSAEGPSDNDRGESHTGAADDLIARIEAADADTLQKITDDWFADGKSMIDEADHARVEAAMDARAAALKGVG